MKSQYPNESYPRSVYPGEYVPLFTGEEVKEELKKSREGIVVEPFVNVSEQENYCKIEVAIPGLQREDFLITIDRHILYISVLHKKPHPLKEEKFKLREFNYDCFSRYVILPENVETEFVTAEYKEGILTMYLLKTDHYSESSSIQVIVY
jgi:HSP20 family protein